LHIAHVPHRGGQQRYFCCVHGAHGNGAVPTKCASSSMDAAASRRLATTKTSECEGYSLPARSAELAAKRGSSCPNRRVIADPWQNFGGPSRDCQCGRVSKPERLFCCGCANSGGSRRHGPCIMLAKRALFQATEESKNVFVIGYCAPDKAFTTKAQGFEAQLTVMEHPQQACWRMFKHASCSHGTSCPKEHPGLQVPVRVFVEAPHFQAAAPPQTIQHCKQEFATFMMTVTSMLASSCGLAASLNSQGGDGWSIEIPLLAEYSSLQEHFLTRARDAFMEASQESKSVYVMGFGSTPFISKSNGFVTMLGDMADECQACWDVYTEGLCSRQCSCRWQHPQCLMPVSVEFKPLISAPDGDAEPPQQAPTASQTEFEEPEGRLQTQLLKEAPWNTKNQAQGRE
jgi:hypothetical protein